MLEDSQLELAHLSRRVRHWTDLPGLVCDDVQCGTLTLHVLQSSKWPAEPFEVPQPSLPHFKSWNYAVARRCNLGLVLDPLCPLLLGNL